MVNVQKLESMAPEFHNLTEALKKTNNTTSSILVDKDGQPSPRKADQTVSPEKQSSGSRHGEKSSSSSSEKSRSHHR